MHAWADVAVLAKTKGANGRFVARCAAGLPFLLEPGIEVAFVPPQLDVPRRAVVESVRQIDERNAEVTFTSIDADQANVLVGSHCLIRREDLDESSFLNVPGSWEGWKVVDAVAGEVGAISGLIDNPAQMLLEVERPIGETLLVPVVDEIVRDVDPDGQTVYVALPKGLLEL